MDKQLKRESFSTLNVKIEKETHLKIKILSKQQEKNICDIVETALKEHLAKQNFNLDL